MLRAATTTRLSPWAHTQVVSIRRFITHGRSYDSRAGSISSSHTPLPSNSQRNTIYALATPPGRGGVAIVRVSGPEAFTVYQRILVTSTTGKSPQDGSGCVKPRRMQRCRVIDPFTGEDLDDGMAVFFKGPHSFTTEDVLELHIHSGRATVNAVLTALSRLHTPPSPKFHPLLLRPADRGEFTRRAFDGGRLDLTQVEALRDLVNAETQEQRKLALTVARGSSRNRLKEIRTSIIKAMAMVEALIDFGEGDNIEDGVYDNARTIVQELRNTISHHLDHAKRGEILRTGVRLTIFGPPNAGKSSLLNFLVQREAAIVTDVPGTTRDVLELALDIGGLAVVISDTAGLRHTHDKVERIGIERTQEQLSAADVSICVLSLPEVAVNGIPNEVESLIGQNTYVLLNKLDLVDDPTQVEQIRRTLSHCAGVWVVSLHTQDSTKPFLKGFESKFVERFSMLGEAPLITTARQKTHLEDALRFLRAFLETDDIVIGAEELRYAAEAVGRVSGEICTEDVLDVVFREFCIGK